MTVDRVRPGTLKPLSVSRGLKSARLKIAVAAVVLAAAMSACGGDKIEYADADVGTLYNKAHEFMAGGQYRFAAVMFDEVERQHPYSIWARRATLMSA